MVVEKVIKRVAKKLIAAGHTCTSILDYRYRCHEFKGEWPPVFVVGAPRSGTTLIYQLLMSAFQFAYLPNVANTFYRCPITALKWGMNWCKTYQSTFSSSHGYEKGCMAPSEAGNIWNRWFPFEKREGFNYTPAGWLSPKARREIHCLVTNVEQIFQAPFITKNVKMCVRLPALKEIFPGALYLHIQRDMTDVILSNLVMRRNRGVSWASVMPKNIKIILDMDEIDQVTHQIMDVEHDMMQDLKLYPQQNVFLLTYHELCDSPEGLLARLAHFFELHKVRLVKKPFSPQPFQLSSPKISGVVQPEEIERIREFVRTRGTV
ncbi:MAG: sulfotransferase [Calditrichaeota bacterium]|nr:MAG: sulfotransferase [Calditrichota bacterium]